MGQSLLCVCATIGNIKLDASVGVKGERIFRIYTHFRMRASYNGAFYRLYSILFTIISCSASFASVFTVHHVIMHLYSYNITSEYSVAYCGRCSSVVHCFIVT